MSALVSTPYIIFITPTVKFDFDFELKKLIDSLDFTHKFDRSNRYAVLFGKLEYNYGNVRHHPISLNSNSLVNRIYNKVSDLFPYLTFNSALVNYYPDSHAVIRLHADDEPDIKNNTVILTLSLGGSRTINFVHKHTHNTICSYYIEHGEFIIFSKSSQAKFLHGILDEDKTKFSPEPRISFTFRHLI